MTPRDGEQQLFAALEVLANRSNRDLRAVAVAWGAGFIAFVIVAASIQDLALRVELGFLVGTAVTTIVMAWALRVRMREGVSEGIDALIEQIGHEPLDL